MRDVLLVLENARSGRAEALDAWYSAEYLPAVLRVDGVLGGRRLRAAADLPDGPDHPFSFLTVYDVASGAIGKVADRLIESGPPVSADAVDDHRSWCFEALRPRVTVPDVVPDTGGGPCDQMVVLTNSVAGGDAELNRWYDAVHVPDVLNGIGGFVTAQRFRRADAALNRSCPWGYLALYDIPPGAIADSFARVQRSNVERAAALAAGREPAVPVSPALAGEFAQWFFRETRPFTSGPTTPASRR